MAAPQETSTPPEEVGFYAAKGHPYETPLQDAEDVFVGVLPEAIDELIAGQELGEQQVAALDILGKKLESSSQPGEPVVFIFPVYEEGEIIDHTTAIVFLDTSPEQRFRVVTDTINGKRSLSLVGRTIEMEGDALVENDEAGSIVPTGNSSLELASIDFDDRHGNEIAGIDLNTIFLVGRDEITKFVEQKLALSDDRVGYAANLSAALKKASYLFPGMDLRQITDQRVDNILRVAEIAHSAIDPYAKNLPKKGGAELTELQ